jgi:hypothetical protein
VPAPAFAFLLLAASIDVEGGAIAEARRGEVPVEQLDEASPDGASHSHPATVSIVTPTVGVALHSHEGSLRLRYGPRLSWLQFHDNTPRRQTDQPFVLHQMELLGIWRSQRGITYTTHVTLDTGDADYTALSTIFGRRQSQIPDIVGFTQVIGSVGALARVAPGWQLDTVLEAFHRATLTQANRTPEPVFDPTAPPPPPPETGLVGNYAFPDDSGFNLTPTLVHALDKTNGLELRTAFGYLAVNNGLKLITVGPTVGLRHAFARRGTLRTAAGIVYAHTLEYPLTDNTAPVPPVDPNEPVEPASQPPLRSTWNPVAEVAVNADLYTSHPVVVSTTFGVSATYYFDPVLATSGTIGSSNASLAFAYSRNWVTGIDAYFSTSLRKNPLPIDPKPDETVVGVAVPIRYRIARNLNAEIGGRWSERAPHLRAADFIWRHREFWIYGMVTGTFDTARPEVTTATNPESATAAGVLGVAPPVPREEQEVSGRVESSPPSTRRPAPLDLRPPPSEPTTTSPSRTTPPPATTPPPTTTPRPSVPAPAPLSPPAN